jgi:hypothetical protein
MWKESALVFESIATSHAKTRNLLIGTGKYDIQNQADLYQAIVEAFCCWEVGNKSFKQRWVRKRKSYSSLKQEDQLAFTESTLQFAHKLAHSNMKMTP